MTKLKLKSGDTAYTELPISEVRMYLSGGSKTGSINGYLEETKATKVLISVHAIVFAYY